MADKLLSAPLEIKAMEEGGEFEGYASVFGVQDMDGDVIVQGAFGNTLAKSRESGRMPKMLWQHNPSVIVGRWTEMAEDENGLLVKGSLILEVTHGREAYALMKAGVLDGLSIGFNIAEGVRGSSGRVIEEVELWEVSLVTWGANQDARITSVKSARRSIRDFERFLREAGFSRKEATAICADGYKAIAQRDSSDDGPELDDLMASLSEFKQSLGVS